MRFVILIFGIVLWLQAAHVEPNDPYLKADGTGMTLIYPPQYRAQRDQIAGEAAAILDTYAQSYGYGLDAQLYLTLASSKNQIANAFSTQIPLNMQVDYIGGALDPDYFATTSWLRTLLLHESAHNYQLNAKQNPLAKMVHEVVGNIPVTWLYFVPVFPLPNLLESSFMLEGNAVLNESLFGNGGRLYSGAFWAMTLTQAKAGYITPERVYNDHLYFPYGTHHYIVGGFFQLFLAQRYGIDHTNRYFSAFSEQWLPFFTNATYRHHFGKNFETLLGEYQKQMQMMATDFHPSRGKHIAFSQSAPLLNSDVKQLFFMVNDARHTPELVTIEKKTGKLERRHTTHLFGKLFRVGEKFYTRASARAAGDAILAGLYDADGTLLAGSGAKAMQCRMGEGEWLYFDINRSLQMPRLFAGNRDLGSVNSSVICGQKDYYYFRQQGKRRTLYRNTTPLLTYAGYYGKVVDVDTKGRVLFVANSPLGSTLYRYEQDGSLSRVLTGDDILDARLLNEHEVIASVIRADGVEVLRLPLKPSAGMVHEVRYFFEKEARGIKIVDANLTKPKPYKAPHNLHYSALEQYLASGEGGMDYRLKVLFADPLERNHLFFYISHIDHETIGGVGYDNSASLLSYGIDLYGRLSDDEEIDSRGYGANAYLAYPWLATAYRRGSVRLDGHLDDDRGARSPLFLSLSWRDRRKFGYGFYDNYRNSLRLFGGLDRGDRSVGIAYSGARELGGDFYLFGGMQYARSDTDRAGVDERGVWIDNSYVAAFVDPSRFVMPSLSRQRYVREAMDAQVTLARMFDWGRYAFSLPLSVRQESLYGRWHYFRLREQAGWSDVREYTLGGRVELLLMHKIPLPLSLEYSYNADIKESERFRFFIDLQF